MTKDEWLAAVAASRPPLTQSQLATLRPICAQMAQLMEKETAPACQQEPHPVITEPERNAS